MVEYKPESEAGRGSVSKKQKKHIKKLRARDLTVDNISKKSKLTEKYQDTAPES
jgi:hypothetical protein